MVYLQSPKIDGKPILNVARKLQVKLILQYSEVRHQIGKSLGTTEKFVSNF